MCASLRASSTMVEGGSLFGAVPIPKRRRTSLKTVPNRAWQYDSQPEESSILSDEAEVAQALQNLASAGPFARAEPEVGTQRRCVLSQQGMLASGAPEP